MKSYDAEVHHHDLYMGGNIGFAILDTPRFFQTGKATNIDQNNQQKNSKMT